MANYPGKGIDGKLSRYRCSVDGKLFRYAGIDGKLSRYAGIDCKLSRFSGKGIDGKLPR